MRPQKRDTRICKFQRPDESCHSILLVFILSILQTLDEQEQYSEDDLREYERMLAEEEQRRQQQGSFGHAQPGVVVSLPY